MTRSYTGRDVGRILEPLLRGARRRLWVSSPYISVEYALLLAGKAREGVDVRLVTSDAPSNSAALSVLADEARRRRDLLPGLAALAAALAPAAAFAYYEYYRGVEAPWWVAAGLLVSLWILRLPGLLALFAGAVAGALAAGLLGLESDAPIYAGAALAVAAYVVMRYSRVRVEYRPLVPVRVYPESGMVHSKIYIIDDVAVTGSANLTRRGLWGNMETITIHEDPREVAELEEQFLKAWEG